MNNTQESFRPPRWWDITLLVIILIGVIGVSLVIGNDRASGNQTQISASVSGCSKPRVCALLRHITNKVTDAKGPRNYAPYSWSKRDRVTANRNHIMVPSAEALNHPRRGWHARARVTNGCVSCRTSAAATSYACVRYTVWGSPPIAWWQIDEFFPSGLPERQERDWTFYWKRTLCNYDGQRITSSSGYAEIKKNYIDGTNGTTYDGNLEWSSTDLPTWEWRGSATYRISETLLKYGKIWSWTPHVEIQTDAYWYGDLSENFSHKTTWLN